ncbi:MAG: amino acid ABC transporter permease [Devosia sp.]|uniref:amino acid ABC transporter permease n=1 Tax=unclassified Devosia TaxID=196773 RepID=UPI00092A5ACE|nr:MULTISPECIES: amino acid ABC transporter permease [unclassified Devosia]MBL8598270.1 amino acid ABC transporter permease [Devosia sp.]MBN9348227.1 amino acid ABC transporter permease [Devosia sp.]OJX47488.1 MAG: amino acid ABC transporter permease [Devosia sp. 66-22]
MGYTLNFAAVWRDIDLLWAGLAMGLLLALASIVVGAVLGLLLSFVLISKSRARPLAAAYVSVFRNTPLLVLVLFTYFALPQLGIRLGKIESFVATLSLYAGAYLAEVFRGALLSVPAGLSEAGLSLGLRPWQTRLLIVVPVMLRTALPSLSSTFISLFKDTSLAAAIAVPELTYYARKINNESFRVIEVWLVASLFYVATCVLLAMLLRLFERRLALPK